MTAEDRPLAGPDHLVVGIGASAGGLEAIKEFFEGLPTDTGMAFVVIQHLDPTHESRMVDLISKYNAMPVRSAEDDQRIEPNRIYVIPPNAYLSVSGMRLKLSEPLKRRGLRMPIDFFFQSLARELGDRGVCIILSGTGSDGTLGMKEVKDAGGIAMVQDPSSAQYDGMPRSALATGLIDVVLPADQLPDTLVRYARHPYAFRALDSGATDLVNEIVSLLYTRTNFDFRPYKTGTLTRRIQRRVGLRQATNLDEYAKILRADPAELRQLTKDLLIGVTSFFRDADAFAVLEEEVIPSLVDNKRPDEPVRVWVAGCNTGEEAYSVSILLHERYTALGRANNAQIFATDVDVDALETARTGRYPKSVSSELSASRLTRYFIEHDEVFEVNKALRESVVFAVQNLITDPPFSKLDLICCRNVLIYLDPDVQSRVLGLLHFGLVPNGVLFLGNSETVGRYQNLFTPVSKPARLYRKVSDASRWAPEIAPLRLERRQLARVETEPPKYPVAELAKRALLETFAPASVLVGRDFEVVYFHGKTSRFLEHPEGEPTGNLIALARDGLKNKLRVAMRQAGSSGETAVVEARRVRMPGGLTPVAVTVTPISNERSAEKRWYLVSFAEIADARAPADGGSDVDDGDEVVVRQLEYELQATREDLQSTIEELETSNEELKASNEEVMSMNEELQSTNEELETSREELQSMNEELTTVNAQLEEKVRQLEEANNDLVNLLASTKVATVFLDTELLIRRFTPAAEALFRLIPGDTGRPMSDLAPRLDDESLEHDCRTVLRDLVTREREVAGHGGEWYIRRVMPYRTDTNRIDGVVITYTDVTVLREASLSLQRRERQQASVAALGLHAIGTTDLQAVFDRVVEDVAGVLNVEYCKILELLPGGEELELRAGVGWQDGLVGSARVGADLSSQAGYTLSVDEPIVVADLKAETRFQGPALLQHHGVRSGVSVIVRAGNGGRWGVLGVHSKRVQQFSDDDVDFVSAVAHLLSLTIERARARMRLRETEARLGGIMDNLVSGFLSFDREDRMEFVNPAAARMFGVDPGQILGERLDDLISALGEETRQSFRDAYTRAARDRGQVQYAAFYPEIDRWLDSRLQGSGAGVSIFIEDITERKRHEEAVAVSEALLRSLADAIPTMVAVLGADGRTEFVNAAFAEFFGRAQERLGGRPLAEAIGAEAHEALETPLNKALDGKAGALELRIAGPHGDRRHLDVRLIPREQHGGAFLCLNDTTDLFRAQAERALLEAAEQERVRIGEELHDSVGQTLTGLNLLGNSLLQTAGRGGAAAPAGVNKLVHGIQEAIDEVRAVTRGLLATVQNGEELIRSLTALAQQTQKVGPARCRFEHDPAIDGISPEVATHLLRIAQEAVTNALRHANPSRIEIELRRANGRLHLEVRDDGPGLDLERSGDGLGLGLGVMRHRAELIDARLDLGPGPLGGLRVTCELKS